MWIAVDSGSEIDEGPTYYNKFYLVILYVIFVFLNTYFVMSLFISVVVNKFN